MSMINYFSKAPSNPRRESGLSVFAMSPTEVKNPIDYVEVKKESVCRFSEYFSQFEVLALKLGDSEPKELKLNRPFLLSSEVIQSNLSKPTQKMKGKKGKGNSRQRSSLLLAKVYTSSQSVPAPMFTSAINKPYRMTQMVAAANLFTSSTTIPTFSSVNFVLSALDNVTSFTNLFDQYMIELIEVWIEGSATTNQGAQLYSVIDLDDSAALTTIAAATDYANCMVSEGNEFHYRRWVPHVAVAVYSGAFTSFGNEQSMWIDSASSNVQHYGLKTACSTTGSATTYFYRYRLHLAFRNLR